MPKIAQLSVAFGLFGPKMGTTRDITSLKTVINRFISAPSVFVSHNSARYTRLVLLATRDITSLKTVINRF